MVSQGNLALGRRLEVHDKVLFPVSEQVTVLVVSVALLGDSFVQPGVLGIVSAEGQAGQTRQLGIVGRGHYQLDVLSLFRLCSLPPPEEQSHQTQTHHHH